MEKKELVIRTLEKMGYKPDVDDDGDVVFRYQMKTICVLVGDEDEYYASVMLPHFYEIEEGEEMLVMAVCNKMTRDLKLVKVFIDLTLKNVCADCEFFFTNEEALEQNLEHSLKLLSVIRSVFKKNKAELSE